MPLAKLFAERVHFFDELAFEEAYPLFDAPISKYDAPRLAISDILVTSPEVEIPIVIYRPEHFEGKLPVIIWMHGGGFQQGTYRMNESAVVGQELAHRGQFIVVNVEYRLVNEKIKFPAPQSDCMEVLTWVHSNIGSLGGDNSKIFVGGVSAGGCLAASMAVLDRDSGNNFVSGQLLNCPIVHTSMPPLSAELSAKMAEVPKELGFTPELIQELNRFVLASGDIQDMNPAWMPGETKDLSGLPPAQIINCEYDTLRASGELYGEQLRAAGVDVEVVTELGVPHAHLNRVPEDCPEVSSTIAKIIDFVNRVAATA